MSYVLFFRATQTTGPVSIARNTRVDAGLTPTDGRFASERHCDYTGISSSMDINMSVMLCVLMSRLFVTATPGVRPRRGVGPTWVARPSPPDTNGCRRLSGGANEQRRTRARKRRHTDTTVDTEAITRTRPSARARMGATRLPSRLTRSRRSLVRPSRGFASRLALARGSAARESLDATRRAPRGSIDTASGGSVDTAFGRPIDTAFGGSVGPFRRSPWSARSTRSGRPRRR